jgi:TrmH family RNA methyltransferase
MLLAEAISAGVEIREVYLRDGEPDPRGVKVVPFVLDARTFDSVNDTVTPQGVLAVCAIAHHPPPDIDSSSWFVVAHEISDPGNLGTIIRSAEAAGATGVYVTPNTVDVHSPKTVRATAGAMFHVPVREVGSLSELASLGLTLIGTSSHGAGQSLYESSFNGPVAVVLGNEAHGLSGDEPIDRWVTIPHAGRAESLNVAMAAAIISMQVSHARRGG